LSRRLPLIMLRRTLKLSEINGQSQVALTNKQTQDETFVRVS
jgi:hypothetical protein